jgi:hypothetical protein
MKLAIQNMKLFVEGLDIFLIYVIEDTEMVSWH